MALDEHRAKFQPNLWNRPNVQEQTLSITDKKQKHQGKKPHHHHALENKYSKDKTKPTDIDEVGPVIIFLEGNAYCVISAGMVRGMPLW